MGTARAVKGAEHPDGGDLHILGLAQVDGEVLARLGGELGVGRHWRYS